MVHKGDHSMLWLVVSFKALNEFQRYLVMIIQLTYLGYPGFSLTTGALTTNMIDSEH